jgi:exosome complex exonuclease DIS3/RRP44
MQIWCIFVILTVDEDDDDERVGLVPDTADDAPRETPQKQSEKSLIGLPVRPLGRVVGIIKRNWRP